MEASYSSFTARLYRWFYFKKVMPENLCPYFWKCVLMYVFFIPFVVISLPVIVCEVIENKVNGYNPIDKPSERFWGGLFIWIILFLLFVVVFFLIYAFGDIDPKTKLEQVFCGMGFGVLVGCIIGAIATLIVKKIQNYEGRYTFKETPDNMFVSYIKAKYNKHCPKINWKK